TSSSGSARYSSSPLHWGQTRISSSSLSSMRPRSSSWTRLPPAGSGSAPAVRASAAPSVAGGRFGNGVAQSPEGRGVAPPAGCDLDPEIEVDPRVEERFDLLPGAPPELPDAHAATPDQDRLLAVPLHVDGGTNVDRVRGLAEFLDRHRDAVWHLLL